MSIPVKKIKSSGGVGGGGSPPHDVVCRSDDLNRGAIKSLLKSSGGVGGGGSPPPMMVEELMIQLGVQPPHDVRRIDDSTRGATN